MTDKNTVLDRYFLDCRCMLLELAATLDRHDRAPAGSAADPRLQILHELIQIVARPSAQPDRAKRMLELMSDPVQ